jgi:dihydrofolate reductase
MPDVICHVSVSLDGFLAGTDPTLERPLGVNGAELHEWHFKADEPGYENDARLCAELLTPAGACVMGHHMFGPGLGQAAEDWTGWWGDEPPYHAPVFVLTHHGRDPVELVGTTFHFVTDGFDAALAAARAAAGDRPVRITGGASVVQQALRAEAIDELTLDIAPVLLGRGVRLLEDVGRPTLEPIEVVPSPRATHVRYRVTYA